jgi:paraquat-inducible protein A
MPELAVCSYCGAVHRRAALPGRTTARCVRCDAPLYHSTTELPAMLGAAVVATLGFVAANAFPLITLTAQGQQTRATLWAAIMESYNYRIPVVAAGLALTLILSPLLELTLLLWVLVPLTLRVRPPGFRLVMRAMAVLRPWRSDPVRQEVNPLNSSRVLSMAFLLVSAAATMK